MKFNGTVLKMETAGPPVRPIANTRDISFTLSIADIDVTDRDSGGWTEVIGGVRGFNGKVTGLVDFQPGTGKDNVRELIAMGIARTLVNIVWRSSLTGDASFTGAALLTNVTFSATHEGEVSWTADVKGSGAIVVATIA